MAWRPRRSAVALAAFAALAVGGPAGAAPKAAYQRSFDATVAYLQQHQNPDGGFGSRPGGASDDSMTDDVVFALACAGINPQDLVRPGGADAYSFMASQSRKLDATTDFERALLVTNAAGADPRAFGGVDLVAELEARQHPDGWWPHERGGAAGGVNDTAFAVLGLALVDAPGLAERRERGLDWLDETAQRADGSWGLTAQSKVGDVDLTAAVVQALATGTGHDDGIADGLAWLRARQGADGGWSQTGKGESNSMSTGWAVQALAATGQDPEAWDDKGPDPLEYLASLQRDDGSIRYAASSDGAVDAPVWTTAQVTPAFAGQPLPVPPVPRQDPGVPDPVTPGTPDGARPDGAGGVGQGGSGTQEGAGVVSGGGGKGAPLFSRPQPQSKGRTRGGVRDADPTPTSIPTPAAGTGGARDPGGIARSNGAGRAGVSPTRSRGDGRAASPAAPDVPAATPGAERSAVTGTLIGQRAASGAGDGTAAAPGLLGSKAGDPGSPVPALVLAGLLLVLAAGGWRHETRLDPRGAGQDVSREIAGTA